MNNDSFSHDTSAQFALSYELLHLLEWLNTKDVTRLKKIIDKAISEGLHDKIQRSHAAENNSVQAMHHHMIDFFDLLDELLLTSINEHIQKKARQKNLFSTLDHIDSNICDTETMRSSIEKTTQQLDHFPQENPQEQLYKELLKSWKPINKNHIN